LKNKKEEARGCLFSFLKKRKPPNTRRQDAFFSDNKTAGVLWKLSEKSLALPQRGQMFVEKQIPPTFQAPAGGILRPSGAESSGGSN
jgi:hypothetical protein